MKPGISAIRIRKGDTVFHVHGDDAGLEGVWLAKGQVDGLYDAPVKTTYKTSAFQEGSRQKAVKWLHRDLALGFHIRDTTSLYELNDSDFRQIFDYEEDMWETNPAPTTIEVETTISGTRCLDVMLYESPEFQSDLDPLMQEYGNLILKLRAGQPFWYEPDPETGEEYADSFSDTTTSASGTVTVYNPTDKIMYQKWVLTRATWTLPDYQWVGAKGQRAPGGPNGDRTISGITVTSGNGGAVVDLDRQELMFRDANDTNILAQLLGKFFLYAIPPYTPSTELVVSYSGAPTGGALVKLVQPRRWTRPWGLERRGDAGQFNPTMVRFTKRGPYTFQIPDNTNRIDMVLLGRGGHGLTGLILPGYGGAHGEWMTTTLIRGMDIDWEVTEITGVIGNTTTAVAGGLTFTADQGETGGNVGFTGEAAGTQVFNGRTYQGGTETDSGTDGHSPGGGGGGGWLLQTGGSGAYGAAWFYAYAVDEEGSGS